MRVNIGLTAHKSHADSEKDPTNLTNFTEDKIILLLVALNKGHTDILKFLLDELCQFWSSKNFNKLLEYLPEDSDKQSLNIR